MLSKTIKALNNERRRKILQILSKRPRTIQGIKNELGDSGPIYRQSINKSISLLEEAHIVSKEYNKEMKKFVYMLDVSKIILEIKSGENR